MEDGKIPGGGQMTPELAAMLARAAVVERPPDVGQEITATFSQDVHARWNVRVVPASDLGPLFQLTGADVEGAKLINWEVPGRRIMFFANDEMIRRVVGALVSALDEAPADPAG